MCAAPHEWHPNGETMTTAAMATYAYHQIDQARTELNAVSKSTRYEGLKLRLEDGMGI